MPTQRFGVLHRKHNRDQPLLAYNRVSAVSMGMPMMYYGFQNMVYNQTYTSQQVGTVLITDPNRPKTRIYIAHTYSQYGSAGLRLLTKYID